MFIQAPRTGCTAVARVLKERYEGEQLPAEDILDERGAFKVPRKHCTVQQLLSERLLPDDHQRSLLIFTAVRNPFDSLASLYIKKRDKYQALLSDKNAWIYRVPGYVEDMEFCRTHSFEAWLEKHYRVSRLDRLLGRGHRSLLDRYTRGVHRVIRFERLQEDFEHVMREAGVQGDASVPSYNATPGREPNYQTYYTPRARQLVEYVFERDLEQYGYSFDGLDRHRAGMPATELAR